MKKYFLILCIFNSILLSAQVPVIEWQKTIGGNQKDWGIRTIKTQDNGYLICGETQSSVSGDKTIPLKGVSDYWIVKTDSLGIIEWQKDIGGSDYDVPSVLLQTSDGGYLIGGNSLSDISGDKTENTHGFNDIWVLKLDGNGEIIWQNTIGGSFTDILSSIIQTPDGGYLLGANSVSNSSEDKSEDNIGFSFGLPYYTYYDYWIIKINSLGTIEWDNTIGTKDNDILTSVINASDGGYIIGGYSNCDDSGDYNGIHIGGYDCWIIKVDTYGNILWQKTIGGTNKDQLTTIINTSDGGYLLGVISNSNISGNKTANSKGGDDFWVIKIDYQGNILWDKTIGGIGTEVINSISKDNNDNYYISGSSNSNISGDKTETSRGGYDCWFVKINYLGNLLWNKTIGGSGNEYGDSLTVVSENNLLLASSSNSNISGDKTENSDGDYDFWLIKLTPENLITTRFNGAIVSVYPNPTTKTLTVSLLKNYINLDVFVTNMLGQKVQQEQFGNASEIRFDLIGENGVYFVEVCNENKERVTFKVVKE